MVLTSLIFWLKCLFGIVWAIYDPVESFYAFLRITSWVESTIELVSPTADTSTEDFYSGSISLAYLSFSVG